MSNKVIKWGFIGCGNVTEQKSGPALWRLITLVLLCQTALAWQLWENLEAVSQRLCTP